MNARPDALRYALAALTAIVVVGLGLRLSSQLNDLGAAHSDVVEAAQTEATLGETVRSGVGPPLLDAAVAPPTDALAQRLKGLGFAVSQTRMVAATPAGRNTMVVRFAAQGRADAAAIDRLALWAQANARSTILESLAATAGADGKSDVTIELDAIVRQAGGKSP
jgi:hypothetical protein